MNWKYEISLWKEGCFSRAQYWSYEGATMEAAKANATDDAQDGSALALCLAGQSPPEHRIELRLFQVEFLGLDKELPIAPSREPRPTLRSDASRRSPKKSPKKKAPQKTLKKVKGKRR